MKAYYFLLVWLEKSKDDPSKHHRGEYITGLSIQKAPSIEAQWLFQEEVYDPSGVRLSPESFLLELARTSVKDIVLIQYALQILILVIFNSFSLT